MNRITGEQLTRETAQKAAEWGFRKFFVDLRDAHRRIGPVDDYNFAYRKAETFGFARGTRHVLLVNSNDRLGQWDFLKTVFTNAGHLIEVFTDEAQAMASIERSSADTRDPPGSVPS